MNSVGMIYQQTPSTAVPSGKSKAVSAETAMEFKQLLSGKNTAEDRNEDSPSDMEAANAAGDTSHSIDNLPDELKQLLLDNDFLATVFSDIISRIAAGEEQEIVQELEQGTLPDVLADYVDQLIAAVPDGEESGTATVEEMINNNPLLSLLFASNPLTLTGTNGDLKANQTEEQSVMQKQFASLIAQVNQLLSSIQTKEDAIKAAPKMLEMLQQWQELAKSSNGSGMQSLVAPNNEQSEDLAVWKNLLETYQKREHFAGKQLYNTDSKVTVTDVSK
ncbi:hypothetical protein [Oceanobacillus massiliensis]|uniref:hypothetical protein n=1 Tax=Oceanobacillus massiliensis TaxID=1465765 RepID=UPI0030183CF1